MDKLSTTIENYLSLMYILERDKEPILGVHLAELLGVTPPTVANTLKRMVRDRLITMDKNGTRLTKAGKQSAREELGHPQTCPHGNPLPGCEGEVSSWIPLTEVSPNRKVTIKRVHELAEYDLELLTFLESKGLMPGAELMVREVLPFNQTITLEVHGQEVTLGFASARYLFVEL